MSHKWFTVKPGYSIRVRSVDYGRWGILNTSFRFCLADKPNYTDMLVYVSVDDTRGVWSMSMFDWEQLVIPRRELDKKFIEGLYDGENIHLFGRGTIRE
jgi:hypothetical protein